MKKFNHNVKINRNTLYLRNALEDLGYVRSTNDNGNCICTDGVLGTYQCDGESTICDVVTSNAETFLYIASITDRTDKNQWFVAETTQPFCGRKWLSWTYCIYDTLQEHATMNNSPNSYNVYRKATVKDILSRITNKEVKKTRNLIQ